MDITSAAKRSLFAVKNSRNLCEVHKMISLSIM